MAADTGFRYRLLGGPFEGTHDFARILGEWVVLFADEDRQPVGPQAAFALAAYRQGREGYRFRYCLTRSLQRFRIDYADGPLQGSELSAVPALWLPAELTHPLDAQARAIRRSAQDSRRRADRIAAQHAPRAIYIAHYERRDWEEGNKYHLTKIRPATEAEHAA